MEVYACGHNAWRQLELPTKGSTPWSAAIEQNESQLQDMAEEPEDFYHFRKVLTLEPGEELLGVFGGLSWTVVKTSSHLYCAGQFDRDLPAPETSDFNLVGTSGTGTVQSSEDFLSLVTPPPNHRQDDFKVQQLVANQACWTVLCLDGSVWTWGDARFPGCLGREVNEENPSSTPTVISSLLPSNISSTVTKIASGGFITAALTSTHDIYTWGSPDPTSSHQIIPELSSDPTPLTISDPEDPSHEFDFMDIGIGAKHVIVLTIDQRILVTGNNMNGQLGLADEHTEDADFVLEWKEITIPSSDSRSVALKEKADTMARAKRKKVVNNVAAGRNASFIIKSVEKAH